MSGQEKTKKNKSKEEAQAVATGEPDAKAMAKSTTKLSEELKDKAPVAANSEEKTPAPPTADSQQQSTPVEKIDPIEKTVVPEAPQISAEEKAKIEKEFDQQEWCHVEKDDVEILKKEAAASESQDPGHAEKSSPDPQESSPSSCSKVQDDVPRSRSSRRPLSDEIKVLWNSKPQGKKNLFEFKDALCVAIVCACISHPLHWLCGSRYKTCEQTSRLFFAIYAIIVIFVGWKSKRIISENKLSSMDAVLELGYRVFDGGVQHLAEFFLLVGRVLAPESQPHDESSSDENDRVEPLTGRNSPSIKENDGWLSCGCLGR